jgi:hypothetical protein
MEGIIFIKGRVKYPITLDPGVWIFDDRKVDLNTYFESESAKVDELEEYTKAVSKHWQREIQEGAIFPPTLKTEKKYEKQKLIHGTFGISLEPFINNAEPDKDASKLVVETESEEHSFDLTTAKTFILAFSKDGQPLREGGPVHIYFQNGTNASNPITNVTAFRVE